MQRSEPLASSPPLLLLLATLPSACSPLSRSNFYSPQRTSPLSLPVQFSRRAVQFSLKCAREQGGPMATFRSRVEIDLFQAVSLDLLV